MRVELNNLGKSFGHQKVFSGIDLTLQVGAGYVVLGGNGSGKSTFLKVLSGALTPSSGTVAAFTDRAISQEDYHQLVAFAAPYLEVIEEYTLRELIEFHGHFKPFLPNLTTDLLVEMMDLQHAQDKPIQAYSSGMKQRLKLGLAFYSDCPILLLDEPTSNLDAAGISWYQSQLQRFGQNRLVVVGSNHQQAEYPADASFLEISAWK